MKLRAIAAKGGRCQVCGYDKCPAALVFHHRSGKDFQIGGKTLAWAKIVAEIEKCDLLCSNCHAETHFGAEAA